MIPVLMVPQCWITLIEHSECTNSGGGGAAARWDSLLVSRLQHDRWPCDASVLMKLGLMLRYLHLVWLDVLTPRLREPVLLVTATLNFPLLLLRALSARVLPAQLYEQVRWLKAAGWSVGLCVGRGPAGGGPEAVAT